MHSSSARRQDDPSDSGGDFAGADPAGRASGLFEPGRNCCAIARARRVGLVVDGEEYFRCFVRAAERATRSIAILAWDFNSSTRLLFDDADGRATGGRAGQPPAVLGDFLNWLVKHRRGLEIHILDWDFPLVYGADREFRPFGLGWRPSRRVHLAWDNTHPLSASHHQKIVLIDDALAFIGGFDLTARRWDTCAHSADDARRCAYDKPYPPFHDLMMAVDGDAARALGAIVRSRWLAATGHPLPPAAPTSVALPVPWPAGLAVDFEDVDVAVARTLPEIPGHPAVTEVEALYLDMIAAARQRIYIENQYFTAYRLGEALEARLAEPDGPEIVIVVRLFSHGWLEEHTMHVLRARLVQRLRAADRHGRFSILYPHLDGLPEKICIDLHSKLMIVDDEILRVGSANLCNRSMGMDSECDAALAAQGRPAVAAGIRAFRNRLLAEHLDVPAAAIEEADQRAGSLREAIDSLAGRSRTLRPLEQVPDWSEAAIELASVGDPEKPVSLERLIDDVSPEQFVVEDENGEEAAGQGERARPAPAYNGARALLRRHAPRLAVVVVVVAALTAMWRYTPLAEWVETGRVISWAHEFAERPWAPLVILLAYTPACVVMFPRPLITLAAVVAFGPGLGFVYALAGILLAALFTYLAGLGIPRHLVRDIAGVRVLRLARTLRSRGLMAVTALRLVPVAPFAVEGLVAAAIGIRLWHFMLGTLLGMLPGTLTTTVFGDQFEAALTDPGRVNYGILAGVVVAVALLTLAVRRWLVAQHHRHGSTAERAR